MVQVSWKFPKHSKSVVFVGVARAACTDKRMQVASSFFSSVVTVIACGLTLAYTTAKICVYIGVEDKGYCDKGESHFMRA